MSKKVICWDTNVWLAYFKQEADKDLDSIKAYLTDASKGVVRILVPAIVQAELFAGAEDKLHTIEQMFQRSYFDHADLSTTIAREAGKLLRKAKDAKAAGKLMLKKAPKLVDYLVLAAAELYEVDELHSYDSDLLELDGKLGIRVKIRKPEYDYDQDLLDHMLNQSDESK